MELAGVKFAWMGGTEAGQGHYYRVQGPSFLIEFDNTQNNGNHIHSVWRDFAADESPSLQPFEERRVGQVPLMLWFEEIAQDGAAGAEIRIVAPDDGSSGAMRRATATIPLPPLETWPTPHGWQ